MEQDLTDAFSRIPHPVAPAGEQSLAYTRLSAQDLSPSFLFLARDLLGKIGALARTCQICQQVGARERRAGTMGRLDCITAWRRLPNGSGDMQHRPCQ